MKKIAILLIMIINALLIVACDPVQEPPIDDDDPVTFTVTFNSDGGTAIDSQVVEEDDFAVEPATPIKEGFTFVYWYQDDESVEFVFETTPITEDITLNVLWTPSGLTDEQKIEEDIAALEAAFRLNDYLVDTPRRGFVHRSNITWESKSKYISSEGIVLPIPESETETIGLITGTFTLGSKVVKHDFEVELSQRDQVVLTQSREVPFENLTTEYEVADSNVTLFFEEEGSVPYIKVVDFFNLLTGFIDPAYELTFTKNENSLEIYYEYYDADEDHTYELLLTIDAESDLITTNDPGFYWAYVYSTATNYGRHIEYVNDHPDASYEEGSDLVYDLAAYGMDIVIEDGEVVLPYYIANQLFAGSSYYNVYYNYDGLYGIYSLPSSSSSEYRTFKESTMNNKDIPVDLVVHTFDFLAFSLDYFYGLQEIMEVDTYYDLLYAQKEVLLTQDPEDLDLGIAHVLHKQIDEPHTSYGYPSYFNRRTWDGPSVSSLSDYGTRFNAWYYQGLIATDTAIEAKWGRGNIGPNAWAASSPNRPNWWFLNESKSAVVLSLDSFSTSDILESQTFDSAIVAELLEVEDSTSLLPVVGGNKFFYYNNSDQTSVKIEILVKGFDDTTLDDYISELTLLGYTHVIEESTTEYKANGYYLISVDEQSYMVYLKFDEAYNLFYLGITNKIPSSYSFGWNLTGDVAALIESDSAVYLEMMLDQILLESPTLERVVLDITWNTGGNVGALYRVVGFITDQPFKVSGINYDTGSKSTSYVQIVGVPYRAELEWGLLTTPTSFSAANELATIFKENNLGPVIGVKTGGGGASITPILLPNGTAFTMSSNNMNAYRTGEGTEENPYVYHHVEFGVEPDYPLDVTFIYGTFSILEALNDYYNES